jgi:small-conductance mechanosensitive channel
MDGLQIQDTELWVRVGIAIGVLVAAWLINRLIRRSIRHFSERYDLANKDPGSETRFRMIARLTSVGVYFLAFGIAFWIVDQETLKKVSTWMFASAGITGIAIGFAAQTVFSNLISGIIIAFVQPVRLGDNVSIDGQGGTVVSIGLFYTTIRMLDNRHLLIPNKLLSDRFIQNFTLVDPNSAAIVLLRLSYSADLEAVRSLLLDAARDHPSSLPEREPTVQVVDADSTGVSMRLMAWASTQGEAVAMAADIREAVVSQLDESDVNPGMMFDRGSPGSTPA